MESITKTTDASGPVWYQDAYFRAHVADEIAPCVDRSRDSYLIHLSLGGYSRTAARMLYNCVRDEISSRDFAGMLSDGDYAVCLTATDLRTAAAFAHRLEQQLSGFEPVVGLAGLGIDGATADAVLEAARNRHSCTQSTVDALSLAACASLMLAA